MFKFLKSLFGKNLPNPYNDWKSIIDPSILQEYKDKGFTEMYYEKYYDIYCSDLLRKQIIEYITNQIKSIFNDLVIGEDYVFDLVYSNQVDKSELGRYLSSKDIERKYHNQEHLYLYIGFNEDKAKEKDSFYWFKWRAIVRNLESGLRISWVIKDWIKQDRNLRYANDKHKTTFIQDLDKLGNDSYLFDAYKFNSYAKELKELIKADLKAHEEINYPYIKIEPKSNSEIEVSVEYDKWLVKDKLEVVDRLVTLIIKVNIGRLYTTKYFYQNLLNKEE